MRRILFFNDKGYIEYPLTTKLEYNGISIFIEDDDIYYMDDNLNKVAMKSQEKYKVLDTEFMILSDKIKKYEKRSSTVTIGNESDIQIQNSRLVISNTVMNVDNKTEKLVYINGNKNNATKINFKLGDNILVESVMIIIYDDYVKITGDDNTYVSRLPLIKEESVAESFPEYKRSPRIIKRLKNDAIDILKPPSKVSRKKSSLLKVIIPPLVMALSTVAISLIMGRSFYMLIGLAGTLVSLVFSITTYYSDKKEIKQKQALREQKYSEYLIKTRKKLNSYKNDEVNAIRYNNPDVNEIAKMVHEFNPRIYERDSNDDDFLRLEIGKSRDKSDYKLTLDYDVMSTDNDDLLNEAIEILDEYKMIDNKSFNINLKAAHLGIVGEKHEVHEQIKLILAQLTFFHSYHDVQIVALYSDEYKDSFDYIKWYPHVKIHSINMTGNINNERVRDHVLGSLHQILKDRKLKRDENRKEMSFLPHFIIVIDDYRLILNHSIMEYLQESTSELGFSLIYTAQKRANLPENIKTVVVMEDVDVATLLINEGIEVNKRLNVGRINNVDLEEMARDLSVLEHMKNISSHIPDSVTFLDMYKVNKPEELNIEERWEKGESHKSLSVPIGLRGEDDLEELNLHEKAHGPHGLVAGTTGSGKSETIQTYILSLAVNFSPYEVGFLLIDYKGGGMANLFEKLPHLLGTITNLDGAESMRALASIKAELTRRQRIFNEHNVNNISNYNKLFRSNDAKEPLPHLFIISDEFAELKKEQPEFMSELVSVARIGRTLGVHLILATQKPTGVVDDQIWSNSKFKLALKVQDESDSKEIIKTSDAAFITQTGRGYLQVGNNEIYELFQSAWSGASYSDTKESKRVDDRIYKINALGQGELINKDLSDLTQSKEVMTTQLDAVVEHISDYYFKTPHLSVMKPWLPSLDKKINNPYITNAIDTSTISVLDLKISLGIIDVPEEQKQNEYMIDFVKEGNLAIFSSSGYGKSTTLGTIMLSLAIKNNPNLLNMYVVDLGNSSMNPYNELPHVADYMNFDSEEKLDKFTSIINNIIKERKQLFGQEMVQNFDMYNQIHKEKPLKAIFIIIDNYDVVKELTGDFEDFVLKTTRDGAGLGIYTIVTATRSNAIRFAVLNNFKNRIAQYMFDESDVSTIIGRSKYKLSEDIKGRALIKQKSINVMQIYSPADGNDDIEFITNLKATINSISEMYEGDKIIGIPVLPDIFTTKDFKNYKCESGSENLVGLSLDKVENVSLDLSNSPYLILGPVKSGKTNLLEILISQSKGDTYIFDSESMELYKYKDSVNYIEDNMIAEFIETLFTNVENRKKGLNESLNNGLTRSPKEYYDTLPKFNIFIDDIDVFVNKVGKIPNLIDLLNQAVSVNISIIGTANSSKMKGYDEITKFFKNTTYGVVLGQLGSTSTFSLSMRDIPVFGYGVLFNNGETKKIKLPKFVETKGECNE